MEKFFNAIRTHNIVTLELLIKLGQDVNVKDGYGNSPLHYAIEHERLGIAKMLLNAGADVNAKGEYENSPLHMTASPEIVKMLVNAGADVNATNKEGKKAIELMP